MQRRHFSVGHACWLLGRRVLFAESSVRLTPEAVTDSPQVANKDSRFRAHRGATSPARGIMLPQFCDGGELFSRRRRGTEDLKTTATDQLCDKNSEVRRCVSLPRGRSQAAYESGVRCHARPKTFVEFCHYQASIQDGGVGSPRARTRLFPVRIRRPRCKANCSRLREQQRPAAATPE